MVQLMEKMSYNPARLYHLDCGCLEENGPADLVIFDPEKTWIVKKEEFASKAANSPFIGEELTGKVIYTICKGTIVYEELS